MPVTPWVGYRPKSWVVSAQWLGYTALWNLLDYAAVTVPVTCADAGVDHPESNSDSEINRAWREHVPRNESDRFNYLQCWFCRFLFLWFPWGAGVGVLGEGGLGFEMG